MAFERDETSRGLELTSLIDVVFLLLIFFLISFAFSLSGEVSESQVNSEMALPETQINLPIIPNDRLDNLLIQVMPDSVGASVSRRAVVLWPAMQDTLHISRRQAFKRALADSTFANFPPDYLSYPAETFATLPACTLISNSITRYIAKDRLFRGQGHPIVEVRADRDTEFRILNFIMEQCSAHKDVIPQIIIRTAP